MRILPLALTAAILISPLLSSCASTGKPSFMKAGFDTQNNEGWASKYIPGIGALSRLVPPPTEARLKWDEQQKRLNSKSWSQDGHPDF